MAKMEEFHAKFWINFLKKRGVYGKNTKVNKFKIFLMTSLFKMLGIALTIRLLELGEEEAVKTYSQLLEKEKLTDEEEKALIKILEDELVHEHEFSEEKSRFKDLLNYIRDAVLGMSDGLVEVLSVSSGLAGAYGTPLPVAIGGAIVGLASVLSMGIGTYTSVKAQKQVRLSIISRVMLASKYVAHVFKERISKLMREKGFSKEAVEAIIDDAFKNRSLLGRMVAEEEYGLREETLEDPKKSGLYTGIFYIIGAFIPLTPYLIALPVIYAMPLSFLLAAFLLMFIGFVIAISAGLSVKRKMAELVVAGLGSAIITFIIGKLASIIFGIEIE